MHQIENEILTVQIAGKGAELQSIYNKHTKLEYLWSADPLYWAKKSPVLFPIVGGLKNNNYTYKGNTYNLNRHGFARDMDFEVTEQAETSITFTLISNEETLKKYPFTFRFSVVYTLENNSLVVSYIVENTGNDEMYFSVGGHPAFKLPIVEATRFEDYYLQFNETENAGRWPLSKDGLILETPVDFLKETNVLRLTPSLFYEDALVFKNLQSHFITIKSGKTPHGISVYFKGFPYLGIWNFKDANFLCIEPWCGIADSVDANGKLEEKEGINKLDAKEVFTASWQAEFF